MRPIINVSVGIIILFALFSFKYTENCTVEYKGIYAFKIDEEHSAVLRFYEDGIVLASSSINDYFDVFTWFHKENKTRVLSGKYKIKKCKISFDVSGETGKQSYEGEIKGNTIELKLTDKATKKSTTRNYTFFAL
ncbi:MAG: hypothetical protein JNL69_03065 [Bacteroidia bacterium]|nr:hypothetical protein [Bacteroidia bacterium]